jgi:uncharacterized membrane protein
MMNRAMEPLVLAVVLGFVSGLRAFTSLAALALVRAGWWGYVVALIAVGEYVADASPKIPSRTALPSIVIRPLSGAVAGWFIASMHGGSAAAGAICGVVGALIGTYGGHAARLATIARIGALPAAIAEDLVAVALAVLVVTR